MRVFPNATPLSRRSMMRGLAFALAGASVPVAAIAGITARKLTAGDDAELLSRCREWKEQGRKLKNMEKGILRLAKEAEERTPPEPPELYEQVKYTGHEVWPGNGSSVNREPWTRHELTRMTEGKHPFWDDDEYPPSLECQAQCHQLLHLLDAREATRRRVWRAHDRFEKQWEGEVDKQWRLFLRIIRTRAETLQGVAGQFEVLERYWYPRHSDSPKVDAATAKMLANVRRLIAAQSAEV